MRASEVNDNSNKYYNGDRKKKSVGTAECLSSVNHPLRPQVSTAIPVPSITQDFRPLHSSMTNEPSSIQQVRAQHFPINSMKNNNNRQPTVDFNAANKKKNKIFESPE